MLPKYLSDKNFVLGYKLPTGKTSANNFKQLDQIISKN